MIRIVITIATFLAVGVLAVGSSHTAAFAQPPGTWAPDARVPGYLDDTFTPYLVADQNHAVHAFASQWVGEEEPQLAIVYRQWSLEGGWTPPNDVLLAPNGNALIGGAFLDQAGVIHVIFGGSDALGANLYYANAPAVLAGRARAWSYPEPVGWGTISPASSALVGDEQGNLIIIYSGDIDGYGVYAIHSTDFGNTWSDPRPIFFTYDPKLTPFSLRLALGQGGKVHAVWNVVTDRGVDSALYYARLDLETDQWSEPFTLEQRVQETDFFGPSFPSLAVAGSQVVVMYNSGNPEQGGTVPRGRPVQRVRLSLDNGESWENPTTPFLRHLGRSGEHTVVVDSNQVVHALFMQRIELTVDGKPSTIDGPWHSEFRNGQWREPRNFLATVAPHDMRAVVCQGNVLLVLWREDPGVGEDGVWYTYMMLDAPELPVVPLPTVSPTPTATPVQSPAPPTPTATRVPEVRPTLPPSEPSQVGKNSAASLFFVAGPVLLFLMGLTIVHQIGRFRRR